MATKTKNQTQTQAPPVPPTPPVKAVHGNGKKPFQKGPGARGGQAEEAGGKPPFIPGFLSGGQLAGMVGQKEMPNALNMLIQPGEDPIELAMRTIIVRDDEISVKIKAYAYRLAKCEEFHDELGKKEILYEWAMQVSRRGIGREQIVDSVTGERSHNEKMSGGGIGQWIRNKAFGNKEE